MRILYDETSDILDVVLQENGTFAANTGYELRDGIIVYLDKQLKPTQMTVVNFRRLTRFPVIHFDQLEAQPEELRKKLLTAISSSPFSAFLRIDIETHYGHIVSPSLLEVCEV